MIPLKNSVTCRKQVTQISLSLLIVVCLSLAIAASPLSLFHIPDAGMRQPQPSNWFPAPENFIIEPAQVARGSSHTITIISTDCEHKKFEGLDKVIIKADLDDLKSRKGIELTPSKNEECKFTAELTITNAALFGVVAINIHYLKDGAQASDSINITVIKEEPLPPGPLVPGLPPQVDIMWSVVPQKIVKDNFGMRIGKVFYCLEVVIGNDTGYDLQIASVAFQLGPTGKNATLVADASEKVSTTLVTTQKQTLDQRLKSIPEECNVKGKTLTSAEEFESYMKCVSDKTSEAVKSVAASQAVIAASLQNQRDLLATLPPNSPGTRIPSASYRMTRGSIEHGQFWNLRNLVVNSLRALGPLLTGFTPYFHALNHQRNYAEAINIISNPFEKGFELIVPDETVPQLQRLDEQSLRDGMIIPNNRQIRTRTFIPKDILRLEKKYRDDPLVVMMSLGKLHIIGDLISYRNRISVTSGGSGEVTPQPTVNQAQYILTLGEKDKTFTVSGTFLEGASLTPDDPANIDIGPATTTANGASAKVSIKDTATVGPHTFRLATKGGMINIPVTFTQPKPEPSSKPIDFKPSMPSINGPATEYIFTVEGRYFQDAKLSVADDSKSAISLVSTDPEIAAGGTKLTGKFHVLETAKATSYTINVSNAQTKEDVRLTFSVGTQPPPSVTDPKKDVQQMSVPTAYKKSEVTLIVKGKNLFNATIDASPTEKELGITVAVIDNKNADRLTAKVFINEKTPEGPHDLTIQNAPPTEGTAVVTAKATFEVSAQGDIAISKVSPDTITANGTDQSLSIEFTDLNSNLLHMADPTFSSEPADVPQLTLQKPGRLSIRESTTGDKLVLDVKVPAAIKAGNKVIVELKNSNGKAVTREFKVEAPPPSVQGFSINGATSPTASGAVGKSVVIVGQNLKGTASVKFVVSDQANPVEIDATPPDADITDTQITVKVPTGLTATTYTIKITTPAGVALTGTFTFIPPPAVPTFPTTVVGGTDVDINGTNLANVQEVKIGGAPLPTSAIKTNTPTKVTITVPTGTANGKISITTPGGTVTSTGDLTITTP